MNRKILYITAVLWIALFVWQTYAHAATYTYVCPLSSHYLDSNKLSARLSNPVVINEEANTITYKGNTYRHIKQSGRDKTPNSLDGCKAGFLATRNGVMIQVCAHTHGTATVILNKTEIECFFPEDHD